ncbi:MAG: NMD3-related protein, partial [bacterium]
MKNRERKKMMESFYEELQEENIFPDIDEINFRYCESSETYKINNKWRRYETIQEVFDETTKTIFKRKLGDAYKVHVKPINPEHKIKEIVVVVEKGKKKEERKIKAIVDKTMNPTFAKKQSKYLEGTLQLRNLDEEMFETLKELLDSAERKFCHVIDLREKGTSVDIDMTCQHEIGKIAR